MPQYADLVVLTDDGPRREPLTPDADGTVRFTANGAPGLYQLSIIFDARDYDWGLLYEPLSKYENTGQITGPWDFSINHGCVPVVPAYWVTINGESVGLWYASRVSLEDLERKRFRGRMAFLTDGPTEVELRPYREMNVRWQSAVLEPDPVDTLEPLPEGILPAAGNAPAAHWADPALWERLSEALDSSHSFYRPALERVFEWVRTGEPGIRGFPALLATWRLAGDESALEAALKAVDDTVALPAFGNAACDCYGHNGDMGAMVQLLNLALAYHALRDHFGEERRERLLEKLRVQGEIFLRQALLMCDYWGGSVLQDHGWKSMFGFGATALHLLGEIPEAERWVSYVIPRLRRSLKAMPRDGVIPATSHYRLFLYTDEVTHYRDTLLALTGEDIFDQPQFPPIVDFLAAAYDEATDQIVATGPDAERQYGAQPFLNRIASKYGDGRAAWFARRTTGCPLPEMYHGNHPYACHLGVVYGLLTHDPAVAPVAPDQPTPKVWHFEDSGLVHYRDDESGMALSVKCGPIAGYAAEPQVTCPCDLLGNAPGAGHFTLVINGVPLLCTPDGGYRLKTFLRSVLLIDDEGQYGDIGYPMSIPAWRHRGERIESAAIDDLTQRAHIRLDLQPAYAEETGVLTYTREFIAGPERTLVVRDHVVCDRPRILSWLFQTKEEFGLTLDGLHATVGQEPALTIAPQGDIPELSASVRPTEVVWSYTSRNHFRPFVHARYDTTAPMESAVVEFAITW